MWFKSYLQRRVMAVGLAVLLAFIWCQISPYVDGIWAVVAAVLVCQTSQSAPLRQGISVFLVMIVAVNLINLCSIFLPDWVQYQLLAAAFVICGSYSLAVRNQHRRATFYLLLFLITAMSAIQLFGETENIRDISINIAIGSLIGIVIPNILFPVKQIDEFKRGIVSNLRALADMTQLLAEWFWLECSTGDVHALKKIDLVRIMRIEISAYPEWVYDVGFNPGLRAGFRTFLINLERIATLIFSIEYFIAKDEGKLIGEELADALVIVLRGNQRLLTLLADYFSTGKLTDDKPNYEMDVNALENIMKNYVPDSLELLDVDDSYVRVVTIVRDVKDMRDVLLTLLLSLPAPKTAV